MDSWICRNLLIIFKNLICGTVVLHNNDFVVVVKSVFPNGFQTVLQSLLLILIGNDNGNKRMSLYRIFHTIKTKVCSMADCSFHPGTLNRTPAGFKSIHLACRIICGRCLMGTPVIQNLRHMHNLTGFFHTAENKIVILRTVELTAKASHFFHKLPSHNKKVTDIIVGAKKIDVKIRL